MVRIDKNVPLPVLEGSQFRRLYPWEDMELGDSFLWENPRVNIRYVRTTVYRAGKKYGKTFRVYLTTEGLRVWCIKPQVIKKHHQ
jgi:hypothetical protein